MRLSLLLTLFSFAYLQLALAIPSFFSDQLSKRVEPISNSYESPIDPAVFQYLRYRAQEGTSRDLYITFATYEYDRAETADGVKLGAHMTIHFDETDGNLQGQRDPPLRVEIVNSEFDPVSRAPSLLGSDNYLIMTTNDQGIRPPAVGSVQVGEATVHTYEIDGRVAIGNAFIYTWLQRFIERFIERFKADAISPETGHGRTISEMNRRLLYAIRDDFDKAIPRELLDFTVRSEQFEKAQYPSRHIQYRTASVTGFYGNVRAYHVFDTNKIRGAFGQATDPGGIFSVADHRNAVVPSLGRTVVNAGNRVEVTIVRTVFADQPWRDRFPDRLSSCRLTQGSGLKRRDACPVPDSELSKSIPSEVPSQIRTTRYRGVKTISIAWKALGSVLGPASVAAGPAFVIVDVVNGNSKAAIIQAVGAAIDIALLIALEPVPALGFVVAAVVAFIPELFTSGANLGRSNNITEIIQFSFFGDRTKTGNEKCNEERKKQSLPENCIVLYGPGHIAKAFNWELFDAVAFVAHFNEGYQMSIADIADSIQIDDKVSNPDPTIVMVECPPPALNYVDTESGISETVWNCDGGKLKYRIDRGLIDFPQIGTGVTAWTVWSRIIRGTVNDPGDCKILLDPLDDIPIPFYNTSILGKPCGFACNVTAAPLGYINSQNVSTLPDVFQTGNFSANITYDYDALFLALPTSTNQTGSPYNLTLPINGTTLNCSLPTDNGTGISVGNETYFNQGSATGNGTGVNMVNSTGIDTGNGSGIDAGNKLGIQTCNGYEGILPQSVLDIINSPSSWLGRPHPPFPELPDSFGFGDAYASSGNDSTTGITGEAYVTPPPESPFLSLNETNAVCHSYTGYNLCLPSGHWPKENARGGFSLTKITNLNGPAGSKVNFYYRPEVIGARYHYYEDRKADTYSVPNTDGNLMQASIKNMMRDPEGVWEVVLPDNIQSPCACVFGAVEFRGDIVCYGVGGQSVNGTQSDGTVSGNNIRDFAKSIVVKGGVTAWLFARTYGDSSERRVTVDLPDLHDLALGTNSGFDGQIGAMAVSLPVV